MTGVSDLMPKIDTSPVTETTCRTPELSPFFGHRGHEREREAWVMMVINRSPTERKLLRHFFVR
jgi:hypothetical protein